MRKWMAGGGGCISVHGGGGVGGLELGCGGSREG